MYVYVWFIKAMEANFRAKYEECRLGIVSSEFEAYWKKKIFNF